MNALVKSLQDADLAWFAAHADALDRGDGPVDEVVPELARRGLFRIGVPRTLGGEGGGVADAFEAIAAVAERSLTAAFVFWGQRTFIEYLLATPNEALRRRWLEPLLAGKIAGATGLSNAMKHLAGIESLQIGATVAGEHLRLDGRLPWVTNLRRGGFLVAAAIARSDGGASIVAFADDLPGVRRSDDLDLLALRGSNTAAIALTGVDLGPEWLIHADAQSFCPAVRPAFLGMQLGLSVGLARASLDTARRRAGAAHAVVLPRVEAAAEQLAEQVHAVRSGLDDGRFVSDAAGLFRLRIGLADLVRVAVGLELDATGGAAYLRERQDGFARRWLEAAFVPVITPSRTQLQGELERQAAHG